MNALLWLALAANAQVPDCAPLPEADLADRIHASLDAIQRADVAGHQAIIKDLEARLPCLDFVPSPDRWAELLVGMAIVEFATGADGGWQAPLATALHIHPDVDLLVGPSHAIRSWAAPNPPASTGQRVPEGVRIYLDGELITKVPETPGLHLAQRRTGDGWTTLLLRDSPIPGDWLEEPKLGASRTLEGRVDLAIRGGTDLYAQQVVDAGNWLSDQDGSKIGMGFSLKGALGIQQLPGLYGDVAVPDLPTTRLLGLHGGVDVPVGPASLRFGAGAQQAEVIGGGQVTSALLWFPTAGFALSTDGAVGVDTTVYAGLTQAIRRAQVASGLTFGAGAIRPRAGVDLLWTSATWNQDASGRAVQTSALSIALSLGATWGDR